MNSLLSFSRRQKQTVAVMADLFFLPLTFCVAIWLRYDSFSFSLFQQYAGLLIACPIVSIPIFIRLGLYRAVIRFYRS